MRLVLALTCLLAISVPTACAAPQAVGIGPDSSVDQVLDALDAVGKSLKDFSADVDFTDVDSITLSETSHLGKLWFQYKPDGNARIRILFDKLKLGEKILPEKTEWLLDNGYLVDRDYHKKQENRRQIVKPGEKLNPIKLGEGPFPLPIGQSKEEVHKLFEVEKVASSKEDPPGTIHLKLTAKPGTRYARKLKTMDEWIDPKTNMPVRIETLEPNETTFHTTNLTNLKRNTGLGEADFTLEKLGGGWNQRQEQLAD